MDYTLNRENEKFKKVDEALKGHIYSISMSETTWKWASPQQEMYMH